MLVLKQFIYYEEWKIGEQFKKKFEPKKLYV